MESYYTPKMGTSDVLEADLACDSYCEAILTASMKQRLHEELRIIISMRDMIDVKTISVNKQAGTFDDGESFSSVYFEITFWGFLGEEVLSPRGESFYLIYKDTGKCDVVSKNNKYQPTYN